MNRQTFEKTVKCELTMTASARKGIEKLVSDERVFFALQKSFTVHIEKRPDNQHGSQSFSFFFDPERNEKLSELVAGRVAVLECVVKNDGFLATGFHIRGKREPVATNRRLRADFKFKVGKSSGIALPIEFATLLRELPIAEERSEYVKKRVGGWEGYLRIMEKNADVEDVRGSVQSVAFNEDFRKVSVSIAAMPGKAWKLLPGFSAKFEGMTFDLGNVVSTDRKTGRVEIELKALAAENARKTGFQGKNFETIVFSNFAELSQVRRLRKGFKDLQDGLAANANLEKILFEERPVVKITNRQTPLQFESSLNEFQQEAVAGAMNASDLYVIQGPPGTGKTTVISEICNQAVKAGMRTLVASQANLAVDNALGRLLDNQDIRILRYGRTESIEEEGRKFIEENVAEHWRAQTAETMETELRRHDQLKLTLLEEQAALQGKLTDLTLEKEEKTALLQKWKEREKEQKTIALEVKELQRSKQNVLLEIEKTESMIRSAERNLKKSEEELVGLQSQFVSVPDEELALKALEAEYVELEERLILLKKSRSIAEITAQLSQLNTLIDQKCEKILLNEEILEKISSVGKLNDLNNLLDEASYVPTSQLTQMMTELIRRIDRLQEVSGEESFTSWSDTLARVDKAITTVTRRLEEHQFHNRIRIPTGFRSRHSLQSIQETVSQVGRYLVQPQVKKLLSTTSFSVEAYDCLENLTKAVMLLHDRKNFISSFLIEAQTTTTLFEKIRQTVLEEFKEKTNEYELEVKRWRQQAGQLNTQLSEIQQLGEEAATEEAISAALIESEEKRDALSIEIEQLKERQKLRTASKQQINQTQEKAEKLKLELTACRESKLELLENETAMDRMLLSKQEQIEKLDSAMPANPEYRIAEILEEQKLATEELSRIDKQIINVPAIQSLQKTWHTMLEEASAYDLDEIRKLYVKHANVIGTTCVASARKEFAEDYPAFDLVIIDEVSKATPPELLLPMLKGKKIVLVGDHHQLPPLVGQETMEEFLEEMPDNEQKQDMERLLKESLFERLFRTLPKQNKTMLGIQYRMHEEIMNTITPFYNESGYELHCGLENSNTERAHHLESPLIRPESHLLWIDQPNSPSYFEAKPKGGTSRYNESELAAIETLLKEIDEATVQAIGRGELPIGTKKQIGVISFYGEQVKRINRLIQEEIDTPNLEFRTGSVDKFQGMEMDVIIVSFVRNHDHRTGDIGFAKDYRRLNVALSRARELLIVVGSSEMFMNRPSSESTRRMYKRLYDTISTQDGIRTLAKPVI